MADTKATDFTALTSANLARGDRLPIIDISETGAAKNKTITAGELLLSYILNTGLLAEYRFDEGSGTTLTDYSGNGNTGSYVGAPTFIPTGGFTAANGKYAAGTTGALATFLTLYLAVDWSSTTPNGSYNCVLGNSTGNSSTNILSGYPEPGIPNIQFFPQGTDTSCPPAKNQVIIAYVISSDGSVPDKIYVDGVEPDSYSSQPSTGRNYRGGIPWFGYSNSGFYSTSNIYYFASYSVAHNAAQVFDNTNRIRSILTLRGTAIPAGPYATTTNPVVVCMGDSNTAGYGVTGWPGLIAPIPTCTMIDYAISGTTTAQHVAMARSIAARYFSPRSTANVLCYNGGTNDSVAPWVTRKQIEAVLSTFRAAGYKVMLLGVLDSGSSGSSRIDSLNAMTRANWRRFADEYVDTGADPLIGITPAAASATYFVSNVHLTASGQTVWKNHIEKAMNRLLGYQDGSVVAVNDGNGHLFAQVVTAGVTVTNTTTETSVIGAAAQGKTGHQYLLANTTNTSVTISGLPYTGTLVVGMGVSGTGIPAGATIATISSTTSITISAAATSTNTGTPLSFKGTGIKGYQWYPGMTMRIRQSGLLTTAVAQTLRRRVYFSGVTMADTTAATMPTSITGLPYRMDVEITCVSIGSAGTFWATGALKVQSAAGGSDTVYPMTNAAVITVDTTADMLVKITDVWGAADAGNIDVAQKLEITTHD